jgi:hypothetical protein
MRLVQRGLLLSPRQYPMVTSSPSGIAAAKRCATAESVIRIVASLAPSTSMRGQSVGACCSLGDQRICQGFIAGAEEGLAATAGSG